MAKTSPAQFIRQVRQEVSKVTWPTRKETGITTAMVFVMVALQIVLRIGG
jgi:preprotein translocase subunit SecE